jgi:hypothetical protein
MPNPERVLDACAVGGWETGLRWGGEGALGWLLADRALIACAFCRRNLFILDMLVWQHLTALMRHAGAMGFEFDRQ